MGNPIKEEAEAIEELSKLSSVARKWLGRMGLWQTNW